jgi:hypothetical protein
MFSQVGQYNWLAIWLTASSDGVNAWAKIRVLINVNTRLLSKQAINIFQPQKTSKKVCFIGRILQVDLLFFA